MAMTLDGTSGITQMTGSIVMSGSTSGTVTIIPTATAGSNTATLPAATGTVMVSGNMPAFSAYANAGQTVTAGTWTKVAINTKIFDTNSYFDATTNYRFQPLIAGYYQVNGTVSIGTTGAAEVIAAIYKNGTIYSRGTDIGLTSQILSDPLITYNEVIYLNGSTDYIELWGLVSHNPRAGNGFRYYDTWLTSRFSAALVRAS